jgi:four helix bundle protein
VKNESNIFQQKNRSIESYRDLLVWQRSMAVVETVYRLTARFPQSEQFGLRAQMRRAAVSVPSNIAEGYGRRATGEYRHHLSISRGSLLELETQVLISKRLNYLQSNDTEPLLSELEQLGNALRSLISKIQ